MLGSSRKTPVWLPILVLLIAMSSIQSEHHWRSRYSLLSAHRALPRYVWHWEC